MFNESVKMGAALKNELKQLLADTLKISEDKLTENTSLSGDLGLDSLDILRVISIIENKYGIELDEDQLDLLDNLDSAYKYVEYLLGQK